MLIRVTPDKEKARSILRMTDATLKMLKEIDPRKYPSQVIREYYGAIRDLMIISALLDGYTVLGEKVHQELIEQFSNRYRKFTEYELMFIKELSETRTKIADEGFFVNPGYLSKNKNLLTKIIRKLKKEIGDKLQ